MDVSVSKEFLKIYELISKLEKNITDIAKDCYDASADSFNNIPNNLSQFNNDECFVTDELVDLKIQEVGDIYLKKTGEDNQKCDVSTEFSEIHAKTQDEDDSSTNVATTQFVQNAIQKNKDNTTQYISGAILKSILDSRYVTEELMQDAILLSIAQNDESDSALMDLKIGLATDELERKIDSISIPDKISLLDNDAGYITLNQVPQDLVTSVNNLTGDVQIDIPTIPTNVSYFTNDAGYITNPGVTSVNNQTGAVSVLENVQSNWSATTGLAAILNKPALKRVATTGDYNDLENLPTIPTSTDINNWNNKQDKLINWVILNQDEPIIDQLIYQNTKYIVQYTFDLDNASVTIPNNCILDFQGGTISNGTVTLQNTELEGDIKWSNVTISGSCTNDVLTPQMFGTYPTIGIDLSLNKIAQDGLGFSNLLSVVNNQNTKSKTIYLSHGHYNLNFKFIITTDCTIYGDGDSSCIDTSSLGAIYLNVDNSENTTNLSCTDLKTQNNTPVTLTEDINKGYDIIKVNDASAFNVGDFVIITDLADGSFDNSRRYYRSGEIVKVHSVDTENNTVKLAGALNRPYFVEYVDGATTTLKYRGTQTIITERTWFARFTPKQFVLKDFMIHTHLVGNTHAYYTLYVGSFINSEFKNLHIEDDTNNVSWDIAYGMNFIIDHCYIMNNTDGGNDSYGISMGACQDFTITDCTLKASWHAITCGGSNTIYGVNNRNFIWQKLFFHPKNISAEGQETVKTDIDIHADAENYFIQNIYSSKTIINVGGYNATVKNCTVAYIDNGFLRAGMTIRECELVRQDLQRTENLFYFSDQIGINYDDYSIILEDNVFHGRLAINLQGGPNAIKEIIFRNNKCDRVQVRNGRVQTLIVENNRLYGNGAELKYTELYPDYLFFRNNVITNGQIAMTFKKECRGEFSHNYITFKNSLTGHDINAVYLYNFDGIFAHNYIENYLASCFVFDYTKAEVTGNVFISNPERVIGHLGNYSSIVYTNNRDNSHKSYGGGYSRLMYIDSTSKCINNYKDVTNDLPNKVNIPGNEGKPVYVQKINKLGYISSRQSGARVGIVTGSSGSNIAFGSSSFLVRGLVYYFLFKYIGGHRVYLSKISSIENTDEAVNAAIESGDLLPWAYQATSPLSVECPDLTGYPYIFVRSNPLPSGNTNSCCVEFYLNRGVSDYDGAEFNVTRAGNTASRPTGYKIFQGFKYFDTTLGKPIWAKTVSANNVTWVDATGTTV